MPGVELRAFRNRTRTVAANETGHIDVAGNYIACLANTGTFRIGIDGGPLEDFERGLKITLPTGDEFKQIRLLDTSGAENTIQLAVGFGDFEDARVTGTITLEQGTDAVQATVSVGVAETLLDAADTNRRALTIQNLGTVDVFVGKTGVTVANGIRLQVGEVYVLSATTAGIFGISGTAAQDVRVLAETD